MKKKRTSSGSVTPPSPGAGSHCHLCHSLWVQLERPSWGSENMTAISTSKLENEVSWSIRRLRFSTIGNEGGNKELYNSGKSFQTSDDSEF